MPRPRRNAQLRRRALSLALTLSAAALPLAAGERPAAACEAAYHYRVFPLGFAGDGERPSSRSSATTASGGTSRPSRSRPPPSI